jgi:hypothetical protein
VVVIPSLATLISCPPLHVLHHVEVAGAVEGDALRVAQAADDGGGGVIRLDAADAPGGLLGHVQRAGWAEGQPVG